jgi:hypothetical protein
MNGRREFDKQAFAGIYGNDEDVRQVGETFRRRSTARSARRVNSDRRAGAIAEH